MLILRSLSVVRMGTGGTEHRILPICEWPRFLFLKLRPTDVLSLTLNIRGMQLIVGNFFTGQTKDSQLLGYPSNPPTLPCSSSSSGALVAGSDTHSNESEQHRSHARRRTLNSSKGPSGFCSSARLVAPAAWPQNCNSRASLSRSISSR